MNIKTTVKYHTSCPLVGRLSKKANVGKDMVKLKPLYSAGGNIKWCSHYRKQYGGLPGGPVVKTLPDNAGDVGSIPG